VKLFFITHIIGILLLAGSSENHLSVKKRILDKAIHKSLNVKDYSLNILDEINEKEGDFYTINSSYSSEGYLYVGKVESCRIGGCSAEGYEESEIDILNEYFNYFIILDENLRVRNVKIYDYNATYGYEICSPFWLRNFNGVNAEEPIALGVEIDAISGATISSEVLVEDLMNKVNLISSFVNNFSYIQK